jgi:hypothetical protein
MTNTKKLFELAELAEASYAKFNLFGQLENALTDSKFSQIQATAFAAHGRVASHQSNTGSGFSATLFEDTTASGNYTLAIRGTAR